MSKEYITIEKKAEFEIELEQLKNVKRKEIADALEYAKSLGDLSENAEYHQAREDQARCEDRINEIEYILKNAVISKKHHSGVVEVGTAVRVIKDGSKEEQQFTILGSEEVDIESGKISNESPLGIALLGKAPGEVATFTTPKGEKVSYTLLKIE
jgi:transcription elongation factor GreA